MAELPLYTVDAFTSEPFAGNPAAVCLLNKNMNNEIRQKIAFEMNYSETAFIQLLEENDSFSESAKFGLRWFTPKSEVPLCGHATLASASVLFQICGNVNQTVTFETMQGELICHRSGNKSVTMDFPQWHVVPAESDLLVSNVINETIGKLPLNDVAYSVDGEMLLIVLSDTVKKETFENLKVDTNKLLEINPTGDKFKLMAITVKGTAENGFVDKCGKPYDFVSRCFAPWYGISEDPVTGSLHCALGPYWSKVLGKNKLNARQCSQRGGDLILNVRTDGRIDLTGNAVIVLKGTLNL